MSASLLLPFTLENLPIRGRILRLYGLDTYIPSLKQANAEAKTSLQAMLVGVSLLLADLKTTGGITLQIQDPTTHATLAVHAESNGTVKAYANDTAQQQPFADYVKNGALFALSVAQEEHTAEMYQSLIPLEGDSVQAALTGYFTQSVQSATKLRIWQNDGEHGSDVACLFLQALPEETAEQEESLADFDAKYADDWHRLELILNTVSTAEITAADTAPEALIFRLFHEDGVRVYEPTALSLTPANPKVARAKMQQALLHIGQTECESMLEDGPIVMRDDYTGVEESFSADDIAGLFKLN